MLLDGRHVAAGVELLVSTARDVLAEAEADGTAERLRDAGAELLVDTCSYLGPVLRPTPLPDDDRLRQVGLVRPGQHRCAGHLRLARGVRASAVDGRVWRDPSLWGDA